MTERKVTFKLGVDVDPGAKRKIQSLQGDLLAAQKMAAPKSTVVATDQWSKTLKGARDFNAERERIEIAANRALVTFAKKYRQEIVADANLLMRESIRIAKEAAAQIKQVEDDKVRYVLNTQKKIRQYVARGVARENSNLNLTPYLSSGGSGSSGSRSSGSGSMMGMPSIPAGDGGGGGYRSTLGGPSESQRSRAGREIREQFSEMGESVMRVSRGMMMLGLVGEKNLDKVRDRLMQAQAAFDLFGGGLKIINKLEKAWAAYTVMIGSATAAVGAHNSALAAGDGIGIASMIGGGRGRAGAGRYFNRNATQVRGGDYMTGRTTTSIVDNPVTQVAAGGGIGAAASYAASYAASGIRGIAGNLWGRASGGWGARMALMRSGSLLAGRGGLAALGPVGAAIGTGMTAYSVGSSLSGTLGLKALGGVIGRNMLVPGESTKAVTRAEQAKQQRSETVDRVDSLLSNKLDEQAAQEAKLNAMRAAGAAIQLGAAKGAFDLVGKTAAIESKLMQLKGVQARTTNEATKEALQLQINALELGQQQAEAAKAVSDEAVRHQMLTASMVQSQARITELRSKASQLTDAEASLREKMKSDADDEAQKLIQSAEQRAAIEQNVANIRAQSARAALQASQQELDRVTNRIKAEQQALLSAQERFGMMSGDEQSKVLKTLTKARTGTQLSREEITSLKALGTTEGDRLASFNARRLANSAYTPQASQLKSIEEQRRQLTAQEQDILQGRVNAKGDRVRPTTFMRTRGFREGWSKQDQKTFSDIELRREMLDQQEQKIRESVANDQQLRRSVFREEAGSLSRSLSQRQSIEAKIATEIKVVAQFETSAQQVAEMAAKQMMAAYQPFVKEVQTRLQVLTKQTNDLIDNRRRLSPGG